jgi:hypothetical protein
MITNFNLPSISFFNCAQIKGPARTKGSYIVVHKNVNSHIKQMLSTTIADLSPLSTALYCIVIYVCERDSIKYECRYENNMS